MLGPARGKASGFPRGSGRAVPPRGRVAQDSFGNAAVAISAEVVEPHEERTAHAVTTPAVGSTRRERVRDVPPAKDGVRQWPQSIEVPLGRDRVAEVKSHFVELRLGVGRRRVCGYDIVVELTADYRGGRAYRDISIAELSAGAAVRGTAYWGELFNAPALGDGFAILLDQQPSEAGPSLGSLTGDS
jgi:hypothetical protein